MTTMNHSRSLRKCSRKKKKGPYNDAVLALTEAAVTPALPETPVGKAVMLTTGGWAPAAFVMLDCATGRADEPETTTAGLETGTTGVTGSGLEATPNIPGELELTGVAVVDVSAMVTATAAGA